LRALRFDPYLLLPRGRLPATVDGYRVAPVREAQHALACEVAAGRSSALLDFCSACSGAPLGLGGTPALISRALAWAGAELERAFHNSGTAPALRGGPSFGGLVMFRRVTPRIVGELALRSLPVPAPKPAQQEQRNWIEFELLDKEGDPVRGLPFAVTQGETTLLAGKLNRFGNVFLDRIDPGSYTFALTAEPEPEPLQPSDFVALELLSEGGRPLSGERFRLIDSAGGVHEGQVDEVGRAVLYGVAPGDCQLSLPGLIEQG
jgi:hypothetical protein